MQQALDLVPSNVQDAIDRIPPEAWPLIDITSKITLAVVAIWIVLSLIAWWRRRAYNLTIASTARRNKKAQPDFLKVDHKARDAAIERGHEHEEQIAERERLEALAAARRDPVNVGERIAKFAALLMSIFTLVCSVLGVVGNVGAMEQSVHNLTATGKLHYLFEQHLLSTIVVLLVIGYNVWHYFKKRKWEEA
ncbi:hypothetical protein [uncultured Sphingomonas sp.]|uniref:hypothetical protein n=1 Tax=uncultured Sphingomonas sp. TaxID=158754 RepID=UPI0035CA0A90